MLVRVSPRPTFEYTLTFGNKPAADACYQELAEREDVYFLQRRKSLEVLFRMDSETEGKTFAQDFERRWIEKQLAKPAEKLAEAAPVKETPKEAVKETPTKKEIEE